MQRVLGQGIKTMGMAHRLLGEDQQVAEIAAHTANIDGEAPTLRNSHTAIPADALPQSPLP